MPAPTLTTTTTTTAHAHAVPPCLAAAGATLVAGHAPSRLPPGLHAWAVVEPPSPACPSTATTAAWRAAVAGLVVTGLGQPVGGLLTPIRLAAPGGQGLLVRSGGGGGAALTPAAAAAWAGSAGGGGGGRLPPVEEEALASLHSSAWAGLGLSLVRTGRDSGGDGGAVAATWALRTAGGPRPPPILPLPPPACPAPGSRPPLTQRLVDGAGRTPVLEVEAVLGRRACLTLQAPFPFRLGPPVISACEGSGAFLHTPPLPGRVAHRPAVDAPDTATVCFEASEEGTACVRAASTLARLTPLARAAGDLVADRHARVALPPAVLTVWAEEGGRGYAFNATDPLGFLVADRPAAGGPVVAVRLATCLDPAGPRPAVVDESAADLVLATSASLWVVLALALLQACRGGRAVGKREGAGGSTRQ